MTLLLFTFAAIFIYYFFIYKDGKNYRLIQNKEKRCPNCKNPVEESFNVCPICKETLKKKCSNCGETVNTQWKYCPYCERAISESGIK